MKLQIIQAFSPFFSPSIYLCFPKQADQPTIPGSTLFSMLDVVPMSEENLANLGLSRSGGFDTTDFSVATTTHINRPPAPAPASPAEQNIQRPSSPNSNV